MRNKGFTLVEILLVMSIMIGLLAMGLGVFKTLNNDRDLNSGYLDLVNTLNEAKSSAVANVNSLCGSNTLIGYRVDIYLANYNNKTVSVAKTPNAYALDVVCADSNGVESGIGIKKKIFPNGITLSSTISNGDFYSSDILYPIYLLFNTDGVSTNSGSISLTKDGVVKKSVSLNSNGSIITN